MKNSWIIAKREFFERIGSRSFLFMAILGPALVLLLLYLLFAIGGNDQQHWKVLIADHKNIMDHKIMAKEDPNIKYYFVNDVIEIEDFANSERYKDFDAMVEINQGVYSNKSGFVFCKEKPSVKMQIDIRYQVERRLEEIFAQEYTDLSYSQFKRIKQPLNLGFKDAFDPTDSSDTLSAWVGLFLGTVIFVFIFLFGMTILRSVGKEKTNRIVEVMLASVSPRALLAGKIIGIGLSAFVQFALWICFIALGLYLMRTSIFVDTFDPAVGEAGIQSITNEFIVLIFDRIQFAAILPYFFIFFVLGYLFYGAFFAALGAISGSESDGQQFLIPLIAILFFSVYAGYSVVIHPEAASSTVYSFLPFTAPIAMMVRLSQNLGPGEIIELYLSILIELISAIALLWVAARLYKNGLLQFGHSIRIRTIFTWLKMK